MEVCFAPLTNATNGDPKIALRRSPPGETTTANAPACEQRPTQSCVSYFLRVPLAAEHEAHQPCPNPCQCKR